MTYKNRDMKNFRARHETIKHQVVAFIGVIILLVILGFLGERDHQDKLDQIERIKCTKM